MAIEQTTEYDTDIVVWSEHQAELLRRVANGTATNEAPDWVNIAVEIAAVGASERRALASHVRNIIEHLTKLAASPAIYPRAGWKDIIEHERVDVSDLLASSPSLRAKLDQVVADQLPQGLRLATSSLAAHRETPTVPIERIKFTTEQVIGDWFPKSCSED